jgi:NAD(P)H-nitrite reductase large subunit
MENKEDTICYCTGTTKTKIKELIANKVDTLSAIINETGATTGCGGCDYSVATFVGQYANAEGDSEYDLAQPSENDDVKE